MSDADTPLDVQCAGTVVVTSFGDVLRSCDAPALAYPPDDVQLVVVAALNWFVVDAPTLAARHCAEHTPFSVPQLTLPRIARDRALRPTSLRPNVTALRRAEESCQTQFTSAVNELPPQDRNRVLGADGVSRVDINRRLLGPLLDDFVYARTWLHDLGSSSGYWAFRWVGLALEMAAVTDELSQVQLADGLRHSADVSFSDAMAIAATLR